MVQFNLTINNCGGKYLVHFNLKDYNDTNYSFT